jgi:hypothetical protein
MIIQLALDKGRFGSWEAASVEEREMCMHLPQGELMDALGGGQEGVKQLLECVRISLMLDDGAGARQGAQDEKGKRNKRRPRDANAADARSAAKKPTTSACRADEVPQQEKKATVASRPGDFGPEH